MLSKNPLVPSKDALRVLRQLALAGSTLATIGIVTVNYHVYRRIKFAEQLLETKKQIRALSTGKRGAHMARMIEAAENGRPCDIQAMRQLRMEEKRLAQLASAAVYDNSAANEAHDKLQKQQDDGRSYLLRERTAQKIRKATMDMTSTATSYVYGRPKRPRPPAPVWPNTEDEDQRIKNQPRVVESAGQGRSSEEIVQKIKKATMAMTATTAVHAYARPKKAIPRAGPNLHDSVASWLESSLKSPSAEHGENAAIQRRVSEPSSFKKGHVITAVKGEMDEDAAGDVTQLKKGMVVDEVEINFSSRVTDPPEVGLRMESQEMEQIRSFAQSFLDGAVEERVSEQHDENIHCASTDESTRPSESALSPEAKFIGNSTLEEGYVEIERNESSSGTPAKSIDPNTPIHSDPPDTNDTSHSQAVPFPDPTTVQSLEAPRVLKGLPPATFANGIEPGKDTKDKGKESSPSTGHVKDPMNIEIQRSHETESINLPPLKPSIDEAHRIDRHLPSDFWNWDGSQLPAELDSAPDEVETEQKQPGFEQSEDAQCDETENRQHGVLTNGQHTPSDNVLDASQQNHSERSSLPMSEKEMRHAITEWESALGVQHGRTIAMEQVGGAETALGIVRREASMKTMMTNDEMTMLARRIENVFELHGRSAGERLWLLAANLRLSHGDLEAVDFLFTEFVLNHKIHINPRHRLVRVLVSYHFKQDRHSRRAAEILFPEPESQDLEVSDSGEASILMSARSSLDFAIRFLAALWDADPDVDRLMVYFRRVISAAKRRGAELVEALFARVIRCLSSVGNIAMSQIVFDEMMFYHRVEPTFFSRTLLLCGYARRGDWERVELEIQLLHNQGFSRTRPHGYALMINAVLQEYASQASVERFQNFLINAIGYWGLMPTSNISATTVQTYISHHRYDLAREWTETLQVLFPQIETETMGFQWLLNNSWAKQGATCLEIEETIKALSYRNPQTRLKTHSVGLVQEALARDLNSKLDAAISKAGSASLDPAIENGDFASTRTLDEYLNAAYSLTASTLAQSQKPAPEVIDLHRQAISVHRLNLFFSGTSSSDEAVEKFTFPDTSIPTEEDRESTPTSSTLNHTSMTAGNILHLRNDVPSLLLQDPLPGTLRIAPSILDFYHFRFIQGLPADHSLVQWVCEKLVKVGRVFDALSVVRMVYRDSARVGNGPANDETAGSIGKELVVRFPIEFFELWMRLALSLKSLKGWRACVQEVLRLSDPSVGREEDSRVFDRPENGSADPRSSPNSLQPRKDESMKPRITSSFMLLARLAAKKSLTGHWKGWSKTVGGRGAWEEVYWLLEELRKRRAQQIGHKEEAKYSWEGRKRRRTRRMFARAEKLQSGELVEEVELVPKWGRADRKWTPIQ
jgi:hypothetical protein